MAIDLFSLRMNLQTTGAAAAKAELVGIASLGETVALKMRGIGTAIAGAFAGLAVGTVLKNFLESSVHEAAESEKSYVNLKIATQNAGLSFRALKPDLDAVTSAIQKQSVFSDEDARGGLARLLTVTGDLTQAKRLLAIAADLAATKNITLSEAAVQVGRVFGGNTRALKEFGIATKDPVEGLRLLEEKLRGTALAAGGTYLGAIIQAKNAWSDLKEVVGGFLIQDGRLTEFFKGMADLIRNTNRELEYFDHLLHPGRARLEAQSTGALNSELAMLRNQAAGLSDSSTTSQGGRFGMMSLTGANPTLAANMDRQKVIQKELVAREQERALAARATLTASAGTTVEMAKQAHLAGGGIPSAPGGLGDLGVLAALAPSFGSGIFAGGPVGLRTGSMTGDLGSGGQGLASQRPGVKLMDTLKQDLYEGLQKMGPFLTDFHNFFKNLFRPGGIGNALKNFGQSILAGMGSIFMQMAAKAIAAAPLFQAIGAAMKNPFTAGFALLAFGIALTALGASMGGASQGDGSGSGGGIRGRSEDSITQIHLMSDGAGGFTAPLSKGGDHFTIIGANDPALHRQLAETVKNARRSGHRF